MRDNNDNRNGTFIEVHRVTLDHPGYANAKVITSPYIINKDRICNITQYDGRNPYAESANTTIYYANGEGDHTHIYVTESYNDIKKLLNVKSIKIKNN